MRKPSKKLALSIARQRFAYGGAPFDALPEPPRFMAPDYSAMAQPPLANISLYNTPTGPQSRPFVPYQPPQPEPQEPAPAAPPVPQQTGLDMSGAGGDGMGGYDGSNAPAGQPGSLGQTMGNIGSGIATAMGYGPGMTMGNTIGSVLGGVVGTALAGPVGGFLGGMAGRHAANAMSTAPEESMEQGIEQDMGEAPETADSGYGGDPGGGGSEAEAADMGGVGDVGGAGGGSDPGDGMYQGGRVGYADGGETVGIYPDPESQLPESMRGQVMRPADPTIRQRMADFLATAGGTRDETAVTRRFGEGVADVVGMTPVGIPMAYEETKRAVRAGEYPEAALSAVGMIPGARPGAKVATETAKEVLTRAADNPRVNMSYKNVKDRVPELTAGAKALEEGKIDSAEYQRLVNAYKPVSPWEAVPQPATYEEMYNALRVNSQDKIGKGAEIPSGYPVGLRLDIPAYTNHGTWVPTIHDAAGGSAKVIAHEPVAMISDVSFTIPESKAFNVATGATKKSPFAKIDGKWMPVTQQDAMDLANEAIKNPKEWRQVGMDPERHSYFYDRATQEPIISAEQVLQVGPLVLARNPTYGDKSAFKYKGGGSVTDRARMVLSRKA